MAGHIATSKATNWTTPADKVALVRAVFNGFIDLDPCSNAQSVVGALTRYELPVNGLKESWDYPTIYCNPPYGRSYLCRTCSMLAYALPMDEREYGFDFYCDTCGFLTRKQVEGSSIADWVKRCAEAHAAFGSEVIGFIPAAVGTAHFQEHVFQRATAVCFLKGREKFGGTPQAGSANVAPMDTAFCYWGNHPDSFVTVFSAVGYALQLR